MANKRMPQACDLAAGKCVPCAGGTPPLAGEELQRLHEELPGWDVVDGKRLTRNYKFPDFAKAMAFVNRVGALAEEQNHHPYIHLTWGKVQIEIWTHKIDGLTESDFILAAKIDKLGAEL